MVPRIFRWHCMFGWLRKVIHQTRWPTIHISTMQICNPHQVKNPWWIRCYGKQKYYSRSWGKHGVVQFTCLHGEKDQSLRICLDPQKLNKALKRFSHKIPTIEEITPSFTKAKVFTKPDAKAAYWECKVAPESQELLTFWGPTRKKYKWLRLSFGLNIS